MGLIAYPYFSDYLSRVAQSRISNEQTRVVSETAAEDLSSELDKAREFNERLIAGRVTVTDPFDPKNETPTDEEYEAVLNLAGDGVMGTITIPKIDVALPIYHGVEGEHMEQGVGHMPSTTLPVGGPSTHAALAGHTGLPTARIFDSLTELRAGDWFVISVMGEDLAYEVTGSEVVLPDETASLHVVPDEDLVTLVTCTPYGVNTHRLLIHAQRCDVPAEWLAMGESPATVPLVPSPVAQSPKFIFTLLGVAASTALLAALAVFAHIRRKRDAGEQGEAPVEELLPLPTRDPAPLGAEGLRAIPELSPLVAAPRGVSSQAAPRSRASIASRVPLVGVEDEGMAAMPQGQSEPPLGTHRPHKGAHFRT